LLLAGAAVGDQVAGDLVEDPLAPVELGLGDPQQRVAQRQRIQDAGVQDGGEQLASRSG